MGCARCGALRLVKGFVALLDGVKYGVCTCRTFALAGEYVPRGVCQQAQRGTLKSAGRVGESAGDPWRPKAPGDLWGTLMPWEN